MLTPMPHQLEDARFLLGEPHRALWNDPGTGKTLTAILAWVQLDRPPMTVVCPPIALSMWRDALVEQGLEPEEIELRRTTRVPREGTPRVRIMSYDILRRLGLIWWGKHGTPVLVLDESDALNGQSARTRLVYGRGHLPGVATSADHVWPLTGTPLRRYADDLWPVCSSLWPDRLAALRVRTRNQFIAKFCRSDTVWTPQGGVSRVIGNNPAGLQLLSDMLLGEMKGFEPVAVRRRIEDVAPSLPPVTFRQLSVPVSASVPLQPGWQARLEALINGGVADEHISTARRLVGIAKAEGAADYIAGERGPLLVLHWHTEVGDALAWALRAAGRTVETIAGSTSPRDRDRAVAAFQAGEVDILLGQIIAMGSAINLQANCKHVVFAERSFSPRDMRQAFARVWRMGQTEHVEVDYLDAAHPLDEATREILERKQTGYDILTGDAAA